MLVCDNDYASSVPRKANTMFAEHVMRFVQLYRAYLIGERLYESPAAEVVDSPTFLAHARDFLRITDIVNNDRTSNGWMTEDRWINMHLQGVIRVAIRDGYNIAHRDYCARRGGQ